MFKELFTETEKINEGTQATITVFDGNEYKTSILQYDGYKEYAGKILKKSYNTPVKAQELVKKSGEIRTLEDNYVEYYTDRYLLKKTTNPEKALKDLKQVSSYQYFFNGEKWFYNKGSLRSLDQLKPL